MSKESDIKRESVLFSSGCFCYPLRDIPTVSRRYRQKFRCSLVIGVYLLELESDLFIKLIQGTCCGLQSSEDLYTLLCTTQSFV